MVVGKERSAGKPDRTVMGPLDQARIRSLASLLIGPINPGRQIFWKTTTGSRVGLRRVRPELLGFPGSSQPAREPFTEVWARESGRWGNTGSPGSVSANGISPFRWSHFRIQAPWVQEDVGLFGLGRKHATGVSNPRESGLQATAVGPAPIQSQWGRRQMHRQGARPWPLVWLAGSFPGGCQERV